MPTVLITGCNRGIGLELARHYGGRNWRVIATCRAPDQADALRALADGDGDIVIHRLDVTDGEAVTALADELSGTPIDVPLSAAPPGQISPAGLEAVGTQPLCLAIRARKQEL